RVESRIQQLDAPDASKREQGADGFVEAVGPLNSAQGISLTETYSWSHWTWIELSVALPTLSVVLPSVSAPIVDSVLGRLGQLVRKHRPRRTPEPQQAALDSERGVEEISSRSSFSVEPPPTETEICIFGPRHEVLRRVRVSTHEDDCSMPHENLDS